MKNLNSNFPLFISLAEREILVVGAGQIAQRRIRTLLDFGTQILVAADNLSEQIREWIDEGQIKYLGLQYESGMLEKKYLVLACTDDVVLNHQIVLECRERNILVNNCSNHEECDFYFPSILKHEEVVIGISGNGMCHKKVKAVRQQLEKKLDDIE